MLFHVEIEEYICQILETCLMFYEQKLYLESINKIPLHKMLLCLYYIPHFCCKIVFVVLSNKTISIHIVLSSLLIEGWLFHSVVSGRHPQPLLNLLMWTPASPLQAPSLQQPLRSSGPPSTERPRAGWLTAPLWCSPASPLSPFHPCLPLLSPSQMNSERSPCFCELHCHWEIHYWSNAWNN